YKRIGGNIGGMNMKKFSIALFSIAFILILLSCGSSNNNDDSMDNQHVSEGLENNNNNVDNEVENASSAESNNGEGETDNNDEKIDNMNDIGMTEFELEVEYAEDEYEAEIEQNSSGTYEAELEDELNNNNLTGDDAFNHIYDIVINVVDHPALIQLEV